MKSIFYYKVNGVKGSILSTRFMSDLEVEIEAEKISEATENIEQYLANNFLKADGITLLKIKLQ